MTPVPDRNTFAALYAGQAPWGIGRPQKPFLDVADRITGSLLDAGCGTGDTALYFAGRGCRVTGIDFIEEAIKRARRKATDQGVPATFLVRDALTLAGWPGRFDNVIDSGLFHVFSDEEPGTQGPRRVSKKELHDAFAQGWAIESIQPCRVEVRPDLKDFTFSESGPKAWFAVVRRTE